MIAVVLADPISSPATKRSRCGPLSVISPSPGDDLVAEAHIKLLDALVPALEIGCDRHRVGHAGGAHAGGGSNRVRRRLQQKISAGTQAHFADLREQTRLSLPQIVQQ